MDLEPEQVEEERHYNQTECSSRKVFAKCRQVQGTSFSVDVEKSPQVDGDRIADGQEHEETDILGGNDTTHIEAGQQEPFPPFSAKRLMSKLVEFNVAEHTEGHEEDQRGVEKDESSLTDMRIVKQDEAGCQNAGRQRVARLPHDQEDDRNDQRAQERGQSSEGYIRDIVLDIGIADVVEQKVAIVTNEPADECEQKFGEGRVDVEEVGAVDVVRRELRLSVLNVAVLSFHC